jgi:hypothetical protein
MGYVPTIRPDALRNEGEIEGFGVTISAMRAVARRQLVGAFAVAVVVVAVAGLIAAHSARRDLSYATAHVVRGGVQQPTFVTPSDQVIAAVKRTTKMP